ncbi:phosphonate ABC transporter, permease protein PhnE [Aureimonas phyllosphaerae]|uniref:Phosphonate transport system permease protein n=1 Tax=Aureimonas phyllosphaerae TaxID=1166078 RepID=A0A7W6BSI2_9HYPH|nr:phosphonate ABC transporter, permease protein PhnE [Aureimonas phyllosphaerae]MBB3935229.1 phosphonate transport system permease protein [Aureimonas phyllosphaerae]MBB3959237.1 phosphonate transport system permease protein [Aureimonas phyllosphaerae]SFF06062.1 phosphonate transport system permease protein [Aureimonas phyllosphaerae]
MTNAPTVEAAAATATDGAPKRSLGSLAVWLGLALLLVWSWGPADMGRWTYLFTDSANMAEYAKGFLSPNFADWRYYLSEMIVTVQIAVWGTFLSVLLSIPFGILSAANVSPWWVHQPARRLMDLFRAIHEVVFAVLFVVAVGLGPFAGVMALFIHTTGILAKLFSEAVEAIDPRPVEAIRTTGASRLQEIVYGVIPQVLPLWISFSLYRLESNVRAATVLGVIGAGGIGQVLFEAIRGFYYPQASAILIIVVATVTVMDIISQSLRKRVI